jgi:hypothetical protein
VKHSIQLLALALVFVAPGCASTPKGKATQLVVATDAGADAFADGWSAYVDGEIARCRAGAGGDTAESRAACLGKAGEGEALEPLLEALVAAQLAVKIAVECEDNPLKVPAEFKAECVDGNADWNALGAKVLDAWKAVQPFYEAMKGK